MAIPYAITRALDPGTGDTLMDGSTWLHAAHPATEVVLRYLRTELGTYAPDTTVGRRFALLDKIGPSTPGLWQTETERALKPLSDNGIISALVVRCEHGGRGAILESVEFTDPRLNRRVTLRRLVP